MLNTVISIWRKSALLLGAAICFLAMIGVEPAHSDQDVHLLIQLDDGGRAFRPESFEKTKAVLASLSQVPLRAVLLPKDSSISERLRLMDAALQPNDRITGIMIGTHGTSMTGVTLLQGMGMLTSAGPVGFIRKMFAHLNGRLAPDLMLYLDACSTTCGGQNSVRTRFGALRDYLSRFGVNRLAAWGSTQVIRGHALVDKKQLTSTLESSELDRESALTVLAMGVLSGLSAAGLGSGITDNFFVLGGFMFVGYLAGVHGTMPLLTEHFGDDGYLVIADANGTTLVEMKANDPRVLSLTCESALVN